ncbi:hypothetical protein [Flavivirga rizhaonensis]|nr:hypothetical protein [Flavivirga rizhaonensis]
MKLFAGSYSEVVSDGLEGHGEGIYMTIMVNFNCFINLKVKMPLILL